MGRGLQGLCCVFCSPQGSRFRGCGAAGSGSNEFERVPSRFRASRPSPVSPRFPVDGPIARCRHVGRAGQQPRRGRGQPQLRRPISLSPSHPIPHHHPCQPSCLTCLTPRVVFWGFLPAGALSLGGGTTPPRSRHIPTWRDTPGRGAHPPDCLPPPTCCAWPEAAGVPDPRDDLPALQRTRVQPARRGTAAAVSRRE